MTRTTTWSDETRQAIESALKAVRETPLADGRTVWDLLTDGRCRQAVVVAERYAAGDATYEQLAAAAWDAADAAWDAARASADAAAAAAWAAADAVDAARAAAAGYAYVGAARATRATDDARRAAEYADKIVAAS